MNFCLPSDVDARRTPPSLPPEGLDGWRAEQLWLSEHCWCPETLRSMSAAVQAAIAVELGSDAPASQARRHLALLWQADPKSTETLRQAARVLRGSELHPEQTGLDLAASSLFLGGLKVRGLLAAMEFGVEAGQRAMVLLSGCGEAPLPPGMASTTDFAERMKARAGELFALQCSLPMLWMGPVTDHLGRALADDPLVRLEYDGVYHPPVRAGCVVTSRRKRPACVSVVNGSGP